MSFFVKKWKLAKKNSRNIKKIKNVSMLLCRVGFNESTDASHVNFRLLIRSAQLPQNTPLLAAILFFKMAAVNEFSKKRNFLIQYFKIFLAIPNMLL